MRSSYKTDVELLTKILLYQNKIVEVIVDYKCTPDNLDTTDKGRAFDLCALYMAQIGESGKFLTDATKKSLKYVNMDTTKYFRNMIDHAYEKVNRKYLKAYIISTASQKARDEIKERIKYCMKMQRNRQ